MKERTLRRAPTPEGGDVTPQAAVKPSVNRFAVAMPVVLPVTRQEADESRKSVVLTTDNGLTAPMEAASAPIVSPRMVLAEGRDYRRIPLDLIDPHPRAPREVYTPEMLLKRGEELRTQGQHDPIHVIPNPSSPGRFIICDGWTRVQSAIEYKVCDDLLAEVHHNLSLDEAAWYGYEQNEGRQGHCDLDRAMFFQRLIDAGASAAEVGRRTKFSKSAMTNFTAFAALPNEVLDVVREKPERFGGNAAYQLSKLFNANGLAATVSMANRFLEGDHPLRWLIAQVEAHTTPRAPRKSSSVSQKNLRYGNGFLRARGDGRVEVEMRVSPELLVAFTSDMEALLAKFSTPVLPAKSSDETSPPDSDQQGMPQ